MGFKEEDCRQALENFDNDVDMASMWLTDGSDSIYQDPGSPLSAGGGRDYSGGLSEGADDEGLEHPVDMKEVSQVCRSLMKPLQPRIWRTNSNDFLPLASLFCLESRLSTSV